MLPRDEERKQQKMNEILSLKGRDEAAELSLGVSWDDLYIPEELRQKLVKYNYKCPTDIQVQCIRNYTKGNDILGSAPTGSGKTLAFVLPILMDIMKEKQAEKKEEDEATDLVERKKKWRISTLISAPTRELCIQISNVIQQFIIGTDIKYRSILYMEYEY